MPPLRPVVTLLLLPLFTLVLGWQLGVRYEQRSLESVREQIDLISTGGVGSGQTISDPQRDADLSLFWGVWRILLSRYIDPTELQVTPMLQGAIRGLVEAIGDPYTVFMSPQEHTEFRQILSGELEGIGAELTLKEGKIVVVTPLEGSPAKAAGLLPGDVIISVDGTSVEGRDLQDVVHRIRGKKGTKVTLTVTRKESTKPVSLTIVRDKIMVPSIRSEIKETGSGSLGYILLTKFGSESAKEVRRTLESWRGKEFEGLILDLRYNGGGYLEGAVDLASIFLKEGKVVSVQRRDGEPQRHFATGKQLLPALPLVVLINEGSASASEIVAGALQDHKRATIIGTDSFGKGTVQEVVDLPGGSSLRITTAHWLTPNGRNLGKEKVHPDIVVALSEEDRKENRDLQLQAAMEWLLDGEDVTATVRTSTGTLVR